MDTYGEFGIPTATQSAPATVDYPEMKGKIAVVTGGARGMGAVFVRRLVAQGVNVFAADLNRDQLAETIDTINAEASEVGLSARAVAHPVDVTVREQLDDLADAAVSSFGGLDYWVNNAGIFPFAELENVDDEQISAVLDVNVKGVLFGAQAAARHMGKGAAIVNMSSVSALRVRRGRSAYCTSKAAVAHLTESMAVELGDKGIRVNSIAPGYIDTAMTLWVREDPEALANALTSVPLHRLGSAEEVASPLLFLLSDSARYITGHSIAVDGGSRHV
ncbi:SDR family oxidoreductase [Corynebacterium glyciniphilum]|uniref:SDR family NAD(P)-dependent oxidoreductase n=1 Tax=Corynebacterium glyciniphilum TaxID=1404244 RepID=UPI0011AB84EC